MSALQLYRGELAARSRAWADLPPDERKRRAAEAARDRDAEALWSLTEAHLVTWGRAGAKLSAHTLRAYRAGVLLALEAAAGVSLLSPPREWGASWVRAMEGEGLKAATVRQRLAAARALWAALRWAGVTSADPFADVKPARDATPAWEKRHPYPPEAVEAMLRGASPRDAALVLLGAHAGLRVSEACAVVGDDVDLAALRLRVRAGKGGKVRTVVLSRRLRDALQALEPRSGVPLLGLTAQGARAALRRLCARVGVKYQGAHSLRHASGTRLYRETGDLETVARHLGHATLETSRVYAKWSDERLAETVGDW